jgi:hypothetical protein
MDTYIWRCGKLFGDCPKRAYLQTNASDKNWPHLDVLRAQILRVCGTTKHAFTLVVDDFGVKYVNENDVNHLIASIKKNYMLTEDWTGNLNCGIQLAWDYAGRTVVISMLGYIKKKLQEYGHIMPRKIQGCPYAPEPKKLGQNPKHLSPRITCQSLTKRELSGSKNCGEHFILRVSSRHDCFNGAKHHCS